MKCKIPGPCTADGVQVVATDYGAGDNTDFILSKHAFAAMARPKADSKLFAYGVVPVDYVRVPCSYPGHTLAVMINKQSRFPDYLAIALVYQDGKCDITAVQLRQVSPLTKHLYLHKKFFFEGIIHYSQDTSLNMFSS